MTFTALREADEEIALFRGLVAHPKPGQPPLNTSEHTIETDLLSLELLNALPLHLAKDSLIVNPFVYLLLPRPGFIPIRNTREVAPKGVFRIPLSYFLGPGFEYTVEGTEERRRPPDSVRHSVSTSWWKSRKVHYFDVPAKIWESDEPDGSEAMHKVTWVRPFSLFSGNHTNKLRHLRTNR